MANINSIEDAWPSNKTGITVIPERTKPTMQISAAPLREQAVTILRDRIVSGAFTTGERLKEKTLIEQLGVSRTVIREALRQLESEHLITITPNVGAVVAALTADIARQLYEVRAALESTAAKLAAANRSDAELHKLLHTLRELDEHHTEAEALWHAKERFYACLTAASHNEIIGEQLAGVQARISQLRRLTLATPNRGKHMVEELRRVVSAIAARDQEAAYAASIEHVETAASIALAHLRQQEERQQQ